MNNINQEIIFLFLKVISFIIIILFLIKQIIKTIFNIIDITTQKRNPYLYKENYKMSGMIYNPKTKKLEADNSPTPLLKNTSI